MTPPTTPTQAMILAAGRGTRLRPYTDSVPKCMTVVAGRPVLEHAVRHLASHGVHELVINLHHLPEPVVEHFGDGGRFGVRIHWSPEDHLLGTAGGTALARRHFRGAFFVWYGDNISNLRLDELAALHERGAAKVTMALHHRDDVSASGIVDVDDGGRVHRFLEKPAAHEVFSHWVNAGVYVLEPSVLDTVPAGVAWDFGRQVFPSLLAAGETIMGYRMDASEQLRWIDRPEDLAKAEAGAEAAS